jgi:oligopeptide transport system substrate-binding protein
VRIAAAALLSLAACSFPDGEWFGRVPTPDPEHLTICNNSEPESLDPPMATTTNALRMSYELFDGLATFDEHGLAAPSLATRWEIAPDLKTFTFHLRDDARWSNGRPLDARDVLYSTARALHPLTAAPIAEDVWHVVHGREYTTGTARLVLRDHPPFAAGDVVLTAEGAPSTNLRRTKTATPLRAAPTEQAELWGTAPANAELTIIELDGCARDRTKMTECGWAYVFLARGDGLYGYVPLAALTQPDADAPIALADGKPAIPARDLLHLPEVLGIDLPDRHTVVFHTNEPVPYFVDLVAQQAYRPVPREAVARQPLRWTRPEHIITSGPFHATRWLARDRIELARADTFWGRKDVRLARLTYLTVDDQATAATLYFQGQCDALVMNHIPTSYFPVLAGEVPGQQKKRDYTRTAILQAYFYLVNVKRFPNVHFRRALSHGLDRAELPLVTKGGVMGSAAYTPGRAIAELSDEELTLCGVTRETKGVAMIVVPNQVCYVPPLGPDFDLAKAKAEWALAKQELGAAMPTSITVRFNIGVEQHKLIAEWVQEQWRKHLGLNVVLETQEWQIFIDATRRKEYDVARFGGTGAFIDPENFVRNWLCAHPDNRPGYCNPEYERLMGLADAEADRGKRLAIIRQAEQLMVDETPIIPLGVYTQHHLIKPYVRGYDINLIDHQSLRRAWIDPDWAKR